jgi:peptidyl-prolyl cis-trans isomerase B (cyclophilin B)
MIKRLVTIIIFCLFIFACWANAQDETVEKKTDKTSEKKTEEKANQRPDEKDKKPEPFDEADVKTMAAQCVTLETEKGNIKLEMFPESAPETVRNFLNLVSIGALDQTKFTRVVPNFIVQGGNLWSNENLSTELKWRSQRTIPDEPNQIKHDSGIVSMARPDEPNGASTHFFILLREASYLDGKFAAFARVVSGLDVVEVINQMPVEGERPKEPVRIKTARVAPCAAQPPS